MEQKIEIESLMKEHEGLKLCTINVVHEGSSSTKSLRTFTPDELKQQVDPVQIAKDYYEASHDGESLPEELVGILRSIISEVEHNQED